MKMEFKVGDKVKNGLDKVHKVFNEEDENKEDC